MTPKQATNHVAQNVYTIPYKQNQLKFIHQTFFCPPIETLIQAIHREHLEGIPFMHTALVRKYLAPSPVTSKGRMKRPQTGIRSTRNSKTSQSLPIQEDECPPHHSKRWRSKQRFLLCGFSGQTSRHDVPVCYWNASNHFAGWPPILLHSLRLR